MWSGALGPVHAHTLNMTDSTVPKATPMAAVYVLGIRL